MRRFAQWLDITLSNRKIQGRTLAQHLGVHASQVSRWRNGLGRPNLATVTRLAMELEEDPLRLAVTAELLDGDLVHIEPLPLPDATARRDYVRSQIQAIKGLDQSERNKLLEAYEGVA